MTWDKRKRGVSAPDRTPPVRKRCQPLPSSGALISTIDSIEMPLLLRRKLELPSGHVKQFHVSDSDFLIIMLPSPTQFQSTIRWRNQVS